MKEFLKNKETSDILFHEFVKCSRLIFSQLHQGRGFGCGHNGQHRHHGHHGQFQGHHFSGSMHAEHMCADVQKIGQGRLLAFLLEKDGISQKELSALLKIAPASVSELINKLETGGYIEKRQNESDKRITNIFLTEGGRFFAQKMEEGRTQVAKDIFSGLSEEEQVQFLSLIQKLMKSLSLNNSEHEMRDHESFRQSFELE